MGDYNDLFQYQVSESLNNISKNQETHTNLLESISSNIDEYDKSLIDISLLLEDINKNSN